MNWKTKRNQSHRWTKNEFAWFDKKTGLGRSNTIWTHSFWREKSHQLKGKEKAWELAYEESTCLTWRGDESEVVEQKSHVFIWRGQRSDLKQNAKWLKQSNKVATCLACRKKKDWDNWTGHPFVHLEKRGKWTETDKGVIQIIEQRIDLPCLKGIEDSDGRTVDWLRCLEEKRGVNWKTERSIDDSHHKRKKALVWLQVKTGLILSKRRSTCFFERETRVTERENKLFRSWNKEKTCLA